MKTRSRAQRACLIALLSLPAVSLFTACAQNENPHIITDSEWDSVIKLRTNTFTLMSNGDIAALKAEADLGKNVGRYKIEHSGFRTWRLDTSTGQMCLLLTTEQDWKTGHDLPCPE